MKKLFFSLFLMSLFIMACNQRSPVQAQMDWRFDRTGVYSNETGLLKSWHENGPELLWYFDGLGIGWSSVLVSNERLYVTGMEDGIGTLFVLDLNGRLLHQIEYGTEWNRSFPGARAMPIANDGKLYVVSGTGYIICYDQATMNIVWQKDFVTEFGARTELWGARQVRWGIGQMPVIVGNKLILMPGGLEHNIVALNKNDGSLIWSSQAEGDLSAYGSSVYVNAPGIVPQVVAWTAEHVVGVNIETGEMLWSFPFKENNSVHPNTPLFYDNKLLIQASYVGSVMLRLINGGRNVEKVWAEERLDPITGHAVIIGDHIYTSSYARRSGHLWFCVNRHTGEILWEDSRSLGSGLPIYADGMLYLYTERGEMALVKPDTERLNIVSQFTIENGTGEHWAHPVIHNGVLYVRRGNSLMAYRIK